MDQSFGGTMNKAGDKINGAARDAKGLVADGVKKAEKFANEYDVSTSDITESVQSQLKALRDQSQVVLERTEDLVKKHPFYAVLGAAAVGAVVASLISTITSRKN